jgi:hypothetical protein
MEGIEDASNLGDWWLVEIAVAFEEIHPARASRRRGQ